MSNDIFFTRFICPWNITRFVLDAETARATLHINGHIYKYNIYILYAYNDQFSYTNRMWHCRLRVTDIKRDFRILVMKWSRFSNRNGLSQRSSAKRFFRSVARFHVPSDTSGVFRDERAIAAFAPSPRLFFFYGWSCDYVLNFIIMTTRPSCVPTEHGNPFCSYNRNSY
jgi:hypothetical protein